MLGGTIRNATDVDTAEIARLLDVTTPPNVAAMLDRGHLLVLDLGGGALGGAVHVDVHDGFVARALCEAYGCDRVETCVELRRSARGGRR